MAGDMSILSNTPIGEANLITDLGQAFQTPAGLESIEPEWLNLLRHRAKRSSDAELLASTDQMLALLTGTRESGWPNDFLQIYDNSRRSAYPLSMRLLDAHHALDDLSHDYQLLCFDLGLTRRMEDDALVDPEMASFVNDILKHLSREGLPLAYQVIADAFTVYGEALVYQMLKQRGGDRLTIKKIKESETSSPDFACSLEVDLPTPRTLEFFIEVKTFDIVNAPQRAPQMLDEGMEAEIVIDEQQSKGTSVAIAVSRLAPHEPYSYSADYDPRSIQSVIDTLCSKAVSAFKSDQFRSGPTFALVSLPRLPLHRQGVNALAPVYYDPYMGGSCVSGVLWHLAFGRVGSPVYFWPEFEGAGSRDTDLQRNGFLVCEQAPEAAGLLILWHDQGYRLDGLYDQRWNNKDRSWSNVETETVFNLLCDNINDRENSMAHMVSSVRDD